MSISRVIPQWLSSSFEELVISAVRSRVVPQHVSIIMDGNRRFARQNHMAIAEGHQRGYDNVEKVVCLLSRLGIPVITVWMFSMDNFGREQKQVSDIMKIINSLVTRWISPGGMIWKRRLKLCVLGETSLLGPEIRDTLREATALTNDNEGGRLNLLLPYNGRHDLVQAVNSLLLTESAATGTFTSGEPEKVTTDDIEKKLMTAGNPRPDIVIRTAESRLSDFMNWQCNESTEIAFCNCLWPEFSLWDLLPILVRWQKGYTEMQLTSE
ncbi:cis-prenyltransferase [Aspergillus hancockii]|nr:cis-prenyltransferase [Aspergillus hancockii]